MLASPPQRTGSDEFSRTVTKEQTQNKSTTLKYTFFFFLFFFLGLSKKALQIFHVAFLRVNILVFISRNELFVYYFWFRHRQLQPSNPVVWLLPGCACLTQNSRHLVSLYPNWARISQRVFQGERERERERAEERARDVFTQTRDHNEKE